MNIKKYNQHLLAVLGTGALIALLVLIITVVAGMFSSMFNSRISNSEGVQVTDTKPTEDSIRTRSQYITFQSPIQLDTALDLYLIPVGQVNLETEEYIKFQSGRGFKFSSGNYKSYNGLSNNFILFEPSKGKRTQIFKDKLAITKWARIKHEEQIFLIFKGAKKDSNKDKLINSSDVQSLFIFFMSDKTLAEISVDDKTVVEFDYLDKTDLVSIAFGTDIDGDNEYNNRKEPMELVTYNLLTRKQTPFVSNSMRNELQKLLDQ